MSADSISTEHPLYADYKEEWTSLRDAYDGERAVKEKGAIYLPPTSGMLADGYGSSDTKTVGNQMYKAYKMRAVFPEFTGDAVDAAIGVMHHKPAVIELPEELEPLREVATTTGESLAQLLVTINENQLVPGRLGLLLDVDESRNLPYIAMYDALDIINWDAQRQPGQSLERLNLVVLKERIRRRNNVFDWVDTEEYRVLVLGDPELTEAVGQPATYFTGLFSNDPNANNGVAWNPADMIAPSIRGRTLSDIPFVFINAKDTLADPDKAPMSAIASLAYTVYRGEADYRQGLFMQSQDTLVIAGTVVEDDPNSEGETRTGAGAVIKLAPNGKAEYIGVNSKGLPEQRQAIENDTNRAMARAGQMLENRSRQRESGDALRIRRGGQTATLNEVAQTGARALERILKRAATWVGADPQRVKVTPNMDFAADTLPAQELFQLMQAKQLGAPLSEKSIHRLMARKDLTEMDYETEKEEIDTEDPMPGGTGLGVEEDGFDDE